MNERIKELAKKAGINLTPAQFSGVLEDEVDEFTLEDFAELIVRECMKAADEGMAQVTMKVEWPSYHIKKHFGVEE